MPYPDLNAPVLDAATFERMLLDPDVSDEKLRPYIVLDQASSDPFRPVARANPARVVAPETEAAVALSSLNGIARWRRHQRYRRQINGWTGLRIVSEGDSWFQYPFLLTDVIDWLSNRYAIFSLDAAGDLISDMVRQGELISAVVAERPHAVLLSGGGNDLLGGANLAKAVLPFEAGRRPEDYLGAGFDANLAAVLAGYTELFERLTHVAPTTPVLCHVYDHAVPNNGRWLGQPMRLIGIVDPTLQRAIVRRIVDRFHSAFCDLAKQFPQVRVIDTRGTVQGRWHDELHPTDDGYAAVAKLFADAIAEATGTAKVEIGVDRVTETAGVDSGFSRYPDAVLIAELGRRRLLREAGDPLSNEPLLIFPSSLTGQFPAMAEAGAKAVADLQSPRGPVENSPAEQRLLNALVSRTGGARLALPSVGSTPEAPSAAAGILLERLATPRGSGLERINETPPDLDRRERLNEARRVLKRLAADARVDQSIIDRMIQDAETALFKLLDKGPDAALGQGEIFGLEAVIETDGSRPVLFVQDGRIDLDAPELKGPLSQRWRGAAARYQDAISRVASAVGAVQLPKFENRRVGTAFAIAPGLVLTNRHVLEEIAIFDGKSWRWEYDAEIDFAGEHGRNVERRFKLVDVVRWGPNPINRRVDFANLDLAILRVADDGADFPKPLKLESSADWTLVGANSNPPIYVMGFPAKPWLASGASEEGPPAPGHEYEQVLERLFASRFGSKRWAPGLIKAGRGQLAADKREWVMSHDASTLGGNSGSCVVEFRDDGERVIGLHFGGRPRVENYAHVIATAREHLANLDGISWV